MNIFITGGTGFIGSELTKNLIAHGHRVTALTRSDASAAVATANGAIPVMGDITTLDLISQQATQADAIIHLAFDLRFPKPGTPFEDTPSGQDQAFIKTVGDALSGTHKPFVITSALGQLPADPMPTEKTAAVLDDPAFAGSDRSASERLALDYAAKGVTTCIVRPAPTVHGETAHGFAAELERLAVENKSAAYIAGKHWASVHVADIADLYRLAVEKGLPGHVYHGIGEQSLAIKDIAALIGQENQLPVKEISVADAPATFGWLSPFVSRDIWGSSALTQQELDWTPQGIGLLQAIKNGHRES